MNKKNRTLEEVVKKITDSHTKEEFEKLLERGGLIYREPDFHRGTIVLYDEYGDMRSNWDSNEDLRKNFATFEEYAKFEAEACLEEIGMTEEEIAEELKSWF